MCDRFLMWISQVSSTIAFCLLIILSAVFHLALIFFYITLCHCFDLLRVELFALLYFVCPYVSLCQTLWILGHCSLSISPFFCWSLWFIMYVFLCFAVSVHFMYLFPFSFSIGLIVAPSHKSMRHEAVRAWLDSMSGGREVVQQLVLVLIHTHISAWKYYWTLNTTAIIV